MIAKSDVVILVVSASLLSAGIYRWQSNVSRSNSRPALASATDSNQRGNNQGTNASLLAAKPTAVVADVTTDSGITVGIDAPVESNFGNAGQTDSLQSSTQDTAISSENTISPSNQKSFKKEKEQPLYGSYEVQPGDTLSRIAILHGTTIDTLRTINDISGSLITVGQNILYPQPAN